MARAAKDVKKPLQDNDLMPWGKHVNLKMIDVPADYLHWLWTNGKQADMVCPVADYIRRNLDGLRDEYPDGIW